MSMTDGELLQRYVREHSEPAFVELAKRHINLVYSAALRQVNGDAHLAEDVTQSVFTALARKAARLVSHTSLTGWLYTSTRFVAANVRRTELRRNLREQEAHAMNAILSQPEPEADWLRLSPLLDEAMHQLEDQDREAVLLRHFENRTFAQIGMKIGLSENAARMRVERALEKLHGILTKQGAGFALVVLGGLLSENAVSAAPGHLTGKVVGAAMAGTAGGTAAFLAAVLAGLKSKVALAGLAGTMLLTAGLVFQSHSSGTVPEMHQAAGNSAAPTVIAVLPPSAPVPASVSTMAMNLSGTNQSAKPVAKPRVRDAMSLHLSIVAADSGKPIPSVPIEYRGWAENQFRGKHFTSDRFGECDVDYPANITELQLTTRKDGCADTRLLWRPPRGEQIPSNYVARVDWPVAISGAVVDADGHPVAGATVGWNQQDDPINIRVPQNHNFGWIETATDENGRWRINRIAEEMLPLIYGSAKHSNYVDTALVFTGRDRNLEKQLRAGTQVFKLGRAVTITGMVVAGDDNPVSGAEILVGTISDSGARRGKSLADGTFSVSGCPPGLELVTAEAKGYAATTMEAELGKLSGPLRLVLTAGRVLRLRVTDVYGTPIPKASIWYDCINGRSPGMGAPPVQMDINPKTDAQGRVVVTNAPDTVMKLFVRANGFLEAQDFEVRPDGEEHVITLQNALTIHGAVTDALTGQRIPKFRIAQGWPSPNIAEGTTNVVWSSIGRFWLDYSGGVYSNTFEEGVLGGRNNPGYVLKFMADDYAPFVSRLIAANEGNVELNVALQRAAVIQAVVYRPNGQGAAFADIGLAALGARVPLVPGGLSHDNVHSGGSLLRTDAKGLFTIQRDDSILRIIAASPDGYGESTPAALAENPSIQLQPWGRLEAICFSAGKPVAGREYGVEFADISNDALQFEFNASRITSDANGKLVLPMLPVGRLNLVRHYHIDHGWINGEKTAFEIKPGETTTLSLGLSNHTVIAHLVWPSGMQRQANWQISASIHAPLPVIPPEIQANPAAMKEFRQTEAFKAARQNYCHYGATISDDGTIAAEEVPSGDYLLSVEAHKENRIDTANIKIKAIAHGGIPLSVPADPPAGTIDVGNVELKAAAETP